MFLPRSRRLGTAVVFLCAVAAGALAACGGGSSAPADDAHHWSGVVRDPPLQMGNVTLPDASAGGKPFTLAADPGGILLVYFGYTNCPDVCPTTMSEIKRVRKGLGDDASRVAVAMVTVDPARDTVAVLSTYVGHFFDDAHALRSDDPAQLAAATADVGVTVSTRPTSDPAFYTVDHTATLFAVDDAGKVVVEWPFGTSAQAIESDVRKILDQEAR